MDWRLVVVILPDEVGCSAISPDLRGGSVHAVRGSASPFLFSATGSCARCSRSSACSMKGRTRRGGVTRLALLPIHPDSHS